MTSGMRLTLWAGCVLALAAIGLPVAWAQSSNCTNAQCHQGIASGKVVHAALQKNCTVCHSELDGSATPHVAKNKLPGGLKAEGLALCAACHDAKRFDGKLVHAPVAAGMCTACHNPHSSQFAHLASKGPAEQCLDCHSDVKKRPHVIIGFSGGGHPLGDVKKDVADPSRPGEPFSCVSCHEPHRGERARLMKFDKGMASCQRCHKM